MTNKPSSTFFQGLFWDKLLEEINSNQKIAIIENTLFLDFGGLVIEPLPLISVSIEVYSIRIKVSMSLGVLSSLTPLYRIVPIYICPGICYFLCYGVTSQNDALLI